VLGGCDRHMDWCRGWGNLQRNGGLEWLEEVTGIGMGVWAGLSYTVREGCSG